MSFKFSWLVELFQDLDAARVVKALPSSRKSNPDHQIVKQWFSKYRSKIDRDRASAHAFLACMFPERLPQRSYAIKETRLDKIFGRILGFGAGRARRLNSWREHGDKDFATCVEEIMKECESDPPSPTREVTLEEIDQVLGQIAANSPFSSKELRAEANENKAYDLLAPILRRLVSHEAKWLIRMILKSYSPIQIPEMLAMTEFHFLLPSVLAVQDSIEAALEFLNQSNLVHVPPTPEAGQASAFKLFFTRDLVPRTGVMMKRPAYEKARSIKHCCQLANKRLMSIERKYDGEYCQIHITRRRDRYDIQIFSKSGKVSTDDRSRLHGPISESLLLGREGCKIKEKCILEGELLVWNTTQKVIQPFHTIRKHVLHGGRFLGTEKESQAPHDEQLMIMFYDVLLLDDKVLGKDQHQDRRAKLKALVNEIPGVAAICWRDQINFGSSRAPIRLQEIFARAITQNWEGLVLKGSNDPYFSLNTCPPTIKLKKDYITGLGDAADLCIVGARRDARVAERRCLGDVSWTTFYIACLLNKAEVIRFNEKPRCKVIDTVQGEGVPNEGVLNLCEQGRFLEIPFALEQEELAVEMTLSPGPLPTVLFKRPIVVEVLGAGFDRNPNCDFFTIRFPRLTKLHLDRTVEDTMTFTELQDMAKASVNRASDTDSQQDAMWIERLTLADGKQQHIVDKSQSTSPGKTPRSVMTASLSPASVRPPRPHVMIRTDTRELSKDEFDERLSSERAISLSVPTPMSGSRTRSKRSASQLQTTPTPAANAMIKRRRMSPPQPKAASFAGPSRPSRSVAARDDVERRSSGPNTRSSGGTPSNSPLIHAQSRASSNTRAPLREVRNLSPDVSRRPRPRPQLIDEDGHSGRRKSKAIEIGLQASTVKEVERPDLEAARASDFPLLSTPPVSSEDSTTAEKSESSLHRTACNLRHEDPHVVPEIHTKLHQPSAALSLPSTATLLSKSLFVPEQERTRRQDLHDLLRQTALSFTYSNSTFIDDLIGDSKQHALVIASSSVCKAVANDIFEVGLQLVKHQRVEKLQEQKWLLFLDYTILEQLALATEHAAFIDDVEACFCAAVELGPGILDEHGDRAAKVIWEWGYVKKSLLI